MEGTPNAGLYSTNTSPTPGMVERWAMGEDADMTPEERLQRLQHERSQPIPINMPIRRQGCLIEGVNLVTIYYKMQVEEYTRVAVVKPSMDHLVAEENANKWREVNTPILCSLDAQASLEELEGTPNEANFAAFKDAVSQIDCDLFGVSKYLLAFINTQWQDVCASTMLIYNPGDGRNPAGTWEGCALRRAKGRVSFQNFASFMSYANDLIHYSNAVYNIEAALDTFHDEACNRASNDDM